MRSEINTLHYTQKANPQVRLFCVCLALTFLAGSFGKAAEDRLLTFKRPQMGTEFTIRAWTEQARVSELEQVVERAFDEIRALDFAFSDYLPESEITLLAKAPAHEAIPVSRALFTLLETAGKLTEETDGAFDVTAGPLIRLWRLSRKNNALPSAAQIASAKARTGFHHLTLDPEKCTVTKGIEGMLFDLGGIAKGYAADVALTLLKDAGFPRSLVAASGDIVVGEAPPGEPGWKIGIETLDLSQPLEEIQTVTLVNQAISTSGDSRRFFEYDGVRYSHIVSPQTGLGLTERIGASVIAPDATTSDSYATAVTLLGIKEGLQFIRNKRGIECQIVTLRDGHEVFLRSDGFPLP